MEKVAYRPILPSDNPYIAVIIRQALVEFGADKPGTVYFDPTTDHLYELFQTPGSYYFIATKDNIIVGGAGFFPTPQLPENTCELVKMYLKPEARGLGIAAQLMQRCTEKAASMGYTHMYIETLSELSRAIEIYEKQGFDRLDKPLGNSGHGGCNIWMLKSIT